MVFAVFDCPVPAITGMRPAMCSTAAAQERVVFDVVQRGRFARRTGDDDRLRAAGQLQVDQATPGVEVDFAGSP
jgi:hypothetical protein